MSNVDLRQLILEADRRTLNATRRRDMVKAECRRRIFTVVDEVAQINLAAAAAADRLEPADLAIYGGGLDWVGGMRAACLPLIADPGLDPGDDANWPSVPEGVAALVAQF